jgi:hypothetical protein
MRLLVRAAWWIADMRTRDMQVLKTGLLGLHVWGWYGGTFLLSTLPYDRRPDRYVGTYSCCLTVCAGLDCLVPDRLLIYPATTAALLTAWYSM